jgi:hypothetical protein
MNMENLRDILQQIPDQGLTLDSRDHSLDRYTYAARHWLQAFKPNPRIGWTGPRSLLEISKFRFRIFARATGSFSLSEGWTLFAYSEICWRVIATTNKSIGSRSGE